MIAWRTVPLRRNLLYCCVVWGRRLERDVVDIPRLSIELCMSREEAFVNSFESYNKYRGHEYEGRQRCGIIVLYTPVYHLMGRRCKWWRNVYSMIVAAESKLVVGMIIHDVSQDRFSEAHRCEKGCPKVIGGCYLQVHGKSLVSRGKWPVCGGGW